MVDQLFAGRTKLTFRLVPAKPYVHVTYEKYATLAEYKAVADRSCQLFTVLGPAGIGKSRLALEFLAARDDALIVRGRCLSYGEWVGHPEHAKIGAE